jgi:hypothetical protein
MSEAVFMVPTVMWHGGDPVAPDVTPPDSEQLLWQLDRALLLLEIAGYQAREVVIDVSGADPAATDLLTGATGPPGSNWAHPAAPGQIGIWVGPRTGMGALEEPQAASLALRPVDFGRSWPNAAGLTFGFTPTGVGWLTLPVLAGAGDLYARAGPAVDALVGTLRAGIVADHQASQPGPSDVPALGLLSMLDPDTWNVSSGSELPDPAAWTLYGPTLVHLGRSIRDLVLAGDGVGLGTFLAQEASTILAPSTLVSTPAEPDPEAIRRHSALERLRESAELLGGAGPALPPDVQPGQWLAAMYAALRPGVLHPPLAVAELDLLTWTEVLMILHSVGVVDFLSYRLAASAGDLYGGKNLKIGDTDAEVGDLQRDLRALGFTMIEPAESGFGLTTDWAVREFQIYAKMPSTARWLRDTFPYADGLEQVDVLPEQRYPGEPTGLVDADTRAAIARWQLNNWRCGVVAEAWTLGAGRRPVAVAAGLDNMWRHDQAAVGLRAYVRDFTGGYDLPATHPPTERHVVGRFKAFASFGGPESTPADDHGWDEAEVLPDITGSATPAGATLSTFRAVRLVAEAECFAHLDSINAWDRAVLSLGPCHWTFALIDENGVGSGELAAFFAYVAERHGPAFDRAVQRFGLRPADQWATTGQPYLSTLRTYVGSFRRLRSDGQWQPLPSGLDASAEPVTETFRGWHWVYRLEMAGRTIPEWQTACWDFARIRLRDLLATPWGTTDEASAVADVRNPDGSTRPATIGDVYTSERSVALLLRWHVKSPAHLVARSGNAPSVTYRAAATLRTAFAAAKEGSTKMTESPTDWEDTEETRLIKGIMDNLPNDVDLRKTMKQIKDWPVHPDPPHTYPTYYALDPATLLPISEGRGSFLADYAGLPAAPDYARAAPK